MNLTHGTYFKEDKLIFHVTTPLYEVPIFGDYMGEMRLIQDIPDGFMPIPLHEISKFFLDEEILACTFRGTENTEVVRRLNGLGFFFVGTYSVVTCVDKEFKPIPNNSDLQVIKAIEADYEAMINIKSKVYDYSTHQLDPLLDPATTSYRNVMRLKSYFTNPNHCAYVGKQDDVVVGYLQFVVNGDTAFCANGAIHPDYQGLFIGAKVYSDAFSNVFKQGVKIITSGYCNQNIPARKLHQACGFKVKDHEIHLRYKTW